MEHKNLLLKKIDNLDLVRTVFERWAYSDKEFYHRNKEMVNQRMGELYFRTAILWMEYGDAEKWKYWKRLCKPFKSAMSRKSLLLWDMFLYNLPTCIGSRLLKIRRNLKQ
jgi:hypothetical protein